MLARGTVVAVAMGGVGGNKPRPCVVVQASDLDFPDTLVVVPFSSQDNAAPFLRPVFLPDSSNGLNETSVLMTNRIGAVMKSKVGRVIGKLSPEDLAHVDLALALVLGLDSEQ